MKTIHFRLIVVIINTFILVLITLSEDILFWYLQPPASLHLALIGKTLDPEKIKPLGSEHIEPYEPLIEKAYSYALLSVYLMIISICLPISFILKHGFIWTGGDTLLIIISIETFVLLGYSLYKLKSAVDLWLQSTYITEVSSIVDINNDEYLSIKTKTLQYNWRIFGALVLITIGLLATVFIAYTYFFLSIPLNIFGVSGIIMSFILGFSIITKSIKQKKLEFSL